MKPGQTARRTAFVFGSAIGVVAAPIACTNVERADIDESVELQAAPLAYVDAGSDGITISQRGVVGSVGYPLNLAECPGALTYGRVDFSDGWIPTQTNVSASTGGSYCIRYWRSLATRPFAGIGSWQSTIATEKTYTFTVYFTSPTQNPQVNLRLVGFRPAPL